MFEYCPLLHNRKRAIPEGLEEAEGLERVTKSPRPPLSIT
jgi:hypothetical protein